MGNQQHLTTNAACGAAGSKRDYDSMNTSVDVDVDNSNDALASLEHDLSQVEQSLEEQQPHNNSIFHWPSEASLDATNTTSPTSSSSTRSSAAAGRAVFDSLASALGSIRQRFQQLQQQHQVTTTSTSTTTSTTTFSERLETAERAHSTRMPLGMMRQQQLLHSQSSPASMTTVTANANANATAETSSVTQAVHAKTTGEDNDDEHHHQQQQHATDGNASDGSSSASTTATSSSKRQGKQRQASALVASRRYAESQETQEIAVHEQVALPPGDTNTTITTTSSSTMETSPTNDEAVQEQDDEDDRTTNIILTQASIQKLDATRHQGQVLLASVVKSLSSSSALDLLPSPSSSSLDNTTFAAEVVPPTVYSWGSNVDFDLFGAESTCTETTTTTTTTTTTCNEQEQPRAIPTESRVGRTELVNVSLGPHHAAFVTQGGSLLICGNNAEGAVDPSQRSTLFIPRPMHLESILSMTTTRVLQVSCGLDHTAVLLENRSVLTFGNNMDGQLGHRVPNTTDNTNARFQSPAAMVLPRRAAQVACGHRFTLVLTTRMEVYLCGREELTGYNTLEGAPPRLPEQNSALQGLPIVYIAAGDQHAVVLTAQGTAYAWGANPTGACGRGFPKQLSVPVPMQVPLSTQEQPRQANGKLPPAPFSNWAAWEVGSPNMITLAQDCSVVDAACGKDFTVLVTQTGDLLVAGSNDQQQLGYSDRASVFPAEKVRHESASEGIKFVSVEAGTHHAILLDSVGDVWSMGNGQGLTKVLDQQRIDKIAAGGTHNLAIAAAAKGETVSNSKNAVTPGLEGLLDGILLETEVSKQESAIQDLADQTEELFRCPAVMNSVFLDPKEIDDLYAKLISVAGEQRYRQRVVSAMERGMLKGLDSIKTARLMYPEAVRCLLLYLQCPLFRLNEERDVQFDVRGEAILSLCETILGLPFEGYKAFSAWSTSLYAKELFVPLLVKPLIDQLNSKIQTERTRAVPVIVGVLRWLQNISERFQDEVVARPEDFHSEGVANLPMESLFEDLMRYKRASKSEKSSNFFLCANPFLLSPSAKRNLLQVENQLTMVRAAQAGGVQFDLARRQFLFQPYFVIPIDRQYMLQQTLQAVASAAPGELRKSLKIVFKGEEGVDAGGVTKEFFQLLVVQLFDINTGMWSTQFGDGLHTWFNSDCTWNQDGYYLVGVLVGLAVYNSVILDVHFPQTVYRKLLGLPLGLEDMVDPEVQRGLQSLLDYDGEDVEDIFCLTFEVTWNSLGMERKKELKLGGANIPVTSDNREEYVMLYVKWLLVDSIKNQYDEFERGFMQVMEGSSLELLRPEELELLVVGTPELDFGALQRNTEYEGGYSKDSPVVQNLWRFVQEASRDTQLKFLKFSTGSTKAPIGGLGEMPFKIQRAGPDSMQLPTSHTCFNTLLVPDYGADYDKLAERLGRAILECEGFGLQ